MRTAAQNHKRAEALADEAVNIFRNAEESGSVFDDARTVAERLRGAQLGALAQVYAILATIAPEDADVLPLAHRVGLGSRVVGVTRDHDTGGELVRVNGGRFGTVLSISPDGATAIVNFDGDPRGHVTVQVERLAVVFGA